MPVRVSIGVSPGRRRRGGAAWSPLSLEPLLWLRADLGITLAHPNFTQPTAFDHADWTKAECTITPNATADPDGGMLADELVENANSGVGHRVYDLLVPLNQLNHAFTMSVSAKKTADSWDYIWMSDGSVKSAFFNITNGTISAQNGGVTATIIDQGNGWFRCSMSHPAAGSQSSHQIGTSANGTGSTTTGSKSVYLHNAQYEQRLVSNWADQSGNGIDYSQGTAAAQPAYTASDAELGGQSSLSFDGAADFLAIETLGSLSSASANHTLIAALKSDTTTATTRLVFDHSSNGGAAGDIRVGRYWTHTANSGKHGFFTGGAGLDIIESAPDTAAQWLEWEQDADGNECRVYENGVLVGVATPVVERAINSDNAAAIGSVFSGAGNYFDGKIAELIYFDRLLDAGERATIGAYLTARYIL